MITHAVRYTTEKGDTLLGLVRRVYGVTEQERVFHVAKLVAKHAANAALIRDRLHLPLEAGLVIEYPSWPSLQPELLKAEAARATALKTAASRGAPAVSRPLAGSFKAPQASGVAATAPRAGALSADGLVDELVKATGLTLASAVEKLKPIDAATADASRTQSPAVMEVRRAGQAIGAALSPARMRELLALSDKALDEVMVRLLRTLAPRNFPPNVDPADTVSVILTGLLFGVSLRLDAAAKLECDRRYLRLAQLIEDKDLLGRLRDDGSRPISMAFPAAQSASELVQALAALTRGDPPGVATPDARRDACRVFGVGDASQLAVSLAQTPPMPSDPLLVFLDAFEADSRDGALAKQLHALATPQKDVHRAAIAAATDRLSVLSAASLEGLDGKTPNAALAAVLPSLLTAWRTRRPSLSREVQEAELADERRMLAGRNFVSFRKDVAAAIDSRILATGVGTGVGADAEAGAALRVQIVVALAVLTMIGHRIAGMKAADIEATVEKIALCAR